MEHEQIAVLRAIRDRLLSNSGNWQDRVFTDRAPINDVDSDLITRPYVIMIVSADQRKFVSAGMFAKVVITVKIVADDKLTALEGSAIVAALLDGQGRFDKTSTPLDGGQDWVIKTVTRDKNISMVESSGNNAYIYHEGSTYFFEVEGT